MRLYVEPFTVHKRYALTLSRGTYTEATLAWVRVEEEGIEGWGEACPFSVSEDCHQSLEDILAGLEVAKGILRRYSPWERQAVEAELLQAGIPSAVRAAVDMALHDWMGKRLGRPLWQLWGLDRSRIPPTTLTIGLSTPQEARQRALAWMEQIQQARAFKIKLGSELGLMADQNQLIAVQEVIPLGSLITVDANGAWTLEQSLSMSNWLAGQGVSYLEQPLERGQEAKLITLWHESKLPIFVDESCFDSRDIPALADRVHGINIKLMKCGGLSEAWRMIHTARAHGLQVMLGCYSNTALGNTAAAHLAPLADYVDLDSHLNLVDDPFSGALGAGGLSHPHRPTRPRGGVAGVGPCSPVKLGWPSCSTAA
jgi:L-alanine-DL-glutamate epimerase-like enolase superfamily enzyme